MTVGHRREERYGVKGRKIRDINKQGMKSEGGQAEGVVRYWVFDPAAAGGMVGPNIEETDKYKPR